MRPFWASIRSRAAAALLLCAAGGYAGDSAASPPPGFHLTARPWTPLGAPREAYLDRIETLCRAIEPYLDEHGVFWDPATGFEAQYSVPYTAFAMGLLVREGRTEPWLRWGTLCMDRATAAFAQGGAAIPDGAGAFFVAPLAGALDLYAGHVEPAALLRWRERLRTPVAAAVTAVERESGFALAEAMSGEWRRAIENLVSRADAMAFVERGWSALQQESESSLAEDTLTALALSALAGAEYDGPSAAAIAGWSESVAERALLFESLPPTGVYADHVFAEAARQALFDATAERAFAAGELRKAGQYRHEAMAAFARTERFRHDDGPWRGFYGITENRFDLKARVGYAPSARISSLTAALAYHTARAYLARSSNIPEAPGPGAIGGYAVAEDESFVANAGGLELVLLTSGARLGVARIGRLGWDDRLGVLGGMAPAWKSGDAWRRVDAEAGAYTVEVETIAANPLLVEIVARYRPVEESGGPVFVQRLILTPDGLHITLRCEPEAPAALSFALLENDGRPLDMRADGELTRTRFADGDDELCVIPLEGAALRDGGETVRTARGDLRSMLLASESSEVSCFVYPRSPGDPSGSEVAASYARSAAGFATALGAVEERTYLGRFAGGGVAKELTWDGVAIVFETATSFVVLREDGLLTAIEAAAAGLCRIEGAAHSLGIHEPLALIASASAVSR